jgi:hypothetical protein
MNETTTKEHTMSKQVHVSHASCDHNKTPVDRAKCRRVRRGGAPETSKAEIVARVKGDNDLTPIRTTIQSSKKSKKTKASAPVLRELLTFDEIPMLICEDPDCEGHPTQEDVDVANTFLMKHRIANLPCEQNDVKPIQVNVIAKGSKVVHTTSGSDDAMLFACTKRPINVDSAKITTNDVTCKNCLKITK